MSRSGALLSLVAASLALAGCCALTPHPSQTSWPSPAVPEAAEERSCPDGFLDALASHVSASTGAEVDVVEDAGYEFRPDRLDDALAAGCVVRVERVIPDGIMIQVFGAGADISLQDALDRLAEAGWVQPFPDVAPWAYESEPRDPAGNTDLDNVGVFPAAGADPILGFPDWAAYFGESGIVLQGS